MCIKVLHDVITVDWLHFKHFAEILTKILTFLSKKMLTSLFIEIAFLFLCEITPSLFVLSANLFYLYFMDKTLTF